MNGIIRGLSLTRPWPFAFMHGSKLVENRNWKPSSSLTGCYIALHSAKSWSEQDREFISTTTGLYVPSKKESPHSEIFGVARWNGGIILEEAETNLPGLIAAGARLPEDQERWFFGPFGWLLEDFVALKNPIPCVGAMGLWGFGSRQDELAALRQAYRESAGDL